MSKSKKSISNKVILIVITFVFIFSNFYFLLLFSPNTVGATGATSVPLLEMIEGSEKITDLTDKILLETQNQLKAVFFKNVLGKLLNQIAQETAIWLGKGGRGEAPLFITDFEAFWDDFSDAAIGDLISRTLLNITGMNVCTMTPKLALQLSLRNPFAEMAKRAGDNIDNNPKLCTWTELRDHWETVGRDAVKDFSLEISEEAGGDFGIQIKKLSKQLPNDNSLSFYDKKLVSNQSNVILVDPSICSAPFKDSGEPKTIPGTSVESVDILCPKSPPLHGEVVKMAKALEADLDMLNHDLDVIINRKAETLKMPKGGGLTGEIGEEEVGLVLAAYDKHFKERKAAVEELEGRYRSCQRFSWNSFKSGSQGSKCLKGLGVLAPTMPEISPDYVELQKAYINDIRVKCEYVLNIINTFNGAYSYLNSELKKNLNADNIKGSVAYNWELMNQMFATPSEPEAYMNMTKEIASTGLSSYVNRRAQAVIDAGWMPLEKTITGERKAPGGATEEKSKNVTDESRSKTSREYTKEIVADALGIFLDTLWRTLAQQLLEGLLGDTKSSQKGLSKKITELDPTQPLPDMVYNPFQEKPNTRAGFVSFVKQTAQQYTTSFTISDLNLLADFQMKIKGRINPNIYNNVIDSNFAVALNSQVTIFDALEDGDLIGDNHFSWGEKKEEGAYHLSDIKKLRKARVVPLGLELAVELIRDCNYRKTSEYANFSDIIYGSTRFGGTDDSTNEYENQRLQNCVFRPATSDEDDPLESPLKEYNRAKLNEVIDATLQQVVDGFSVVGTGVCGDGDDDESPFCNLVNPGWVLKIPLTKCSSESELEPYGEILQTNETGQRYSRCTDFVSCLKEDGRGGCVEGQYGFCVKEKNTWKFGANSCPSQYNSCTNYSMATDQGNVKVSYLRNTLAGSEICGPDNAGCLWYATRAKASNLWTDYGRLTSQTTCEEDGIDGIWENDHCKSERIYLNRYVKNCDKSDEGCSEFTLFRSPLNNLVFDSSFEYVEEGSFPPNWELNLKSEMIDDSAECISENGDPGKEFAYCINYDYIQSEMVLASDAGVDYDQAVAEILCKSNSGVWSVIDDIASCTSAYKLLDINDLVNEKTDCETYGGDYKRFCSTSLLKYNLCQGPLLGNQEICEDNDGTWLGECQIDTGVAPELTNDDDCSANEGNWYEFCKDAKLYSDKNKMSLARLSCKNLSGEWKGFGPFSDIARVTKEGTNAYDNRSNLEVETSNVYGENKIQLVYNVKFPDNRPLTKAGDIYTATAQVKASPYLIGQANFNLIKIGPDEINSKYYNVESYYSQLSSTLVTSRGGSELNIMIDLPGNQVVGSKFFLDAVDLYLNTADQIYGQNFDRFYDSADGNNKYYYKKPSSFDNCHGYEVGDPPPVLALSREACEAEPINGYYDEFGLYTEGLNKAVCYKYPPDDSSCNNFLKPCEAKEVGCQLYTPLNNDPVVPGVVTTLDYCPYECVGYSTYTQEAILYDPDPDPLFNHFIPETANRCSVDEVGCTEYTNLDEVSRGGEGVEYYTYLRQCIKPSRDLGEKTFFTLNSLEGQAPQYIKYEFQAEGQCSNRTYETKIECETNNGLWSLAAPKMIDTNLFSSDSTRDCRFIIGEGDFNCVKFYDSDGNIYYRDIRKTVSVSENCHPYRKTIALDMTTEELVKEEDICLMTNGNWQDNACIYNVIPEEGRSCRAQANGCRAYVGNRGNNVFISMFDAFEVTESFNWYPDISGSDSGSLAIVGESLVVGGHSLSIQATSTVSRPINIDNRKLYTLSFWAKTEKPEGDVIGLRFSTSVNDNNDETTEEFATLGNEKVSLKNEWTNYSLGPVYVSWENISDNRLLIEGIDSKIHIDNILVKSVKDNVYVVKNSWKTPESCDKNIYGVPEKYAMLGCQGYKDLSDQAYYLKSFTSLCRSSVVGCQILVDTKNSISPYSQEFNMDNGSYLDDYEVPADQLMTYVLNSKHSCDDRNSGCQLMGKKGSEVLLVEQYDDVYLINDPDLYKNVPNATMCDSNGYGCTELINENGSPEYYKIEPEKLCFYEDNQITGVSGWYKQSNHLAGCGSLPYGVTECAEKGYKWSTNHEQCVIVLNEILDQELCNNVRGDWEVEKITISTDPLIEETIEYCLAWPFSIYKVDEANKYNGYVGECDSSYSGCTEFIDINPNYVFNGSFETLDVTNNIARWQSTVASTGGRRVENDDVKLGEKALKLIKYTDAECPSTIVYPDCSAPAYSVTQRIGRLEGGRNYKISMYYKVNEDSKGVGENCPLPQPSFTFNSLGGFCTDKQYNTQEECVSNLGEDDWTDAFKTPRFVFEAEGEWKRADVIFTVPAVYGEIQDYQLTLSGPLNNNTKTGLGNCRESYILYDQIEIKNNQEDSYYVLDTGNSLDRSSCTSVNWDEGCVQFLNSADDDYELLKVKRDRDCGEWAICESYCSDPYNDDGEVIDSQAECRASGEIWDRKQCTVTSLCTKSKAGKCIEYSIKRDNVRYDILNEPIEVNRITDYEDKLGYVYRFGTRSLDHLVTWRAGDYSGYTLPHRIPIEAELNSEVHPYDVINNLDEAKEDDGRYTSPICKIFPSENAPLPYDLSLKQQYKNLQHLYSQSYKINQLGNMCSYEKANAGFYSAYLPMNESNKVSRLCTRPENKRGQVCNSYSDCDPSDDSSCSIIELVKPYYGIEGLCLEYDILNPLYSDLYSNYKNSSDYQQYACLTYYPFTTDLCGYYKTNGACESNINCRWIGGTCEFTQDNNPPLLKEVKAIDERTNLEYPFYTFSSSKKGNVYYSGACKSTFDFIVDPKIEYKINLTNASGGSLAEGIYTNCRITVIDGLDNESAPLTILPFTIDRSAPVISILGENVAFVDGNPYVIFTSDEPGTFSFTDDSCSSDETELSFGENIIALTMDPGIYTCSILAYDLIGNGPTSAVFDQFTID